MGEKGWKRALVAGAFACLVGAVVGATAGSAKGQELPLSLCDPRQHTFTTNITNQFFPLPVGQRWSYSGKEQGQTVGLRITVLKRTETFRFGDTRVTTRVVEELEWVDENANAVFDRGEELIERSLNYFAQTEEGTVCYFGETVDIYEDGVIVSHEGSWRADAPGNSPGIFMPANPQEGMTFQQENAPGVAEDRATVTKISGDTITVRDFNPLDGSRSTKVYVAGVGLVRDDAFDLVTVEQV